MSTISQIRFPGAVALSRLVPDIAREALRKNGFLNYNLLANWREIAGPALSSFALPLKLTGAAGRSAAGDRRTPDSGDSQRAATLVLKVDPARSLEVQYLVPQLIDRINACLGYRAISTIRMIQAPLPRSEKPKRPLRQRLNPTNQAARTFPGETRLDRALARLNASRAERMGTH
jgi:hypothetical protein